MMALDGIAKRYGERFLFRELSLRLGDDERVALVGPNGAGKSTLMRIITGEVEPDAGSIVRSRSNTVGYLPQDGVRHAGRTVLEEAAGALDEIMSLHARAGEIHRELEERSSAGLGGTPEVEELAAELGKVQHHLEQLEGYSVESRAERVLCGLGFGKADLARRTEELSGGWQMRLALARLLLREPTILMLDEPTNHLDIESLEWLEEYLRGYDGTVVLISHDRRFLDNLARRTLELAGGRLEEYRGNFSFHLEEKVARLEARQARWEGQQARIREVRRFVERFRYKATKARQVQSRLRMLERLETAEPGEGTDEGVTFDFPPPPAAGRVLVRLEGVDKRYGGTEVFRGLDLLLERGDRVAFLGANGTGKSTLARIIAGLEPTSGGRLLPGHNVRISYFAQNQAEALDPGRTVLETLEDASTGEARTRLRTLLGCFLFRGDDADKRVGVLSGGEKSRLALARMLLAPANLLVLDEPTNHLDMRSKGVLQEALERFEGSFVLVSHDRDFLETLVNKVAWFEQGGVRVLPGAVDEVLERLRREREEPAADAREVGAARAAKPSAGEGRTARDRRREEAKLRQERRRLTGPLEQKLAVLEAGIGEAESRKRELEQALASARTYSRPESARALSVEYSGLNAGLERLYAEWAGVQEELEKVRARFEG